MNAAPGWPLWRRDSPAGLDPAQIPHVMPYLARGLATLNLAVLKVGNLGWLRDAAMPLMSAIHLELDDRKHLWRVMPDRRGALGSAQEPVAMVGLHEAPPVPVRGGELPDRPWLGLDADEFTLAGEEDRVEATLLPGALSGGKAWVTRTPLDNTTSGSFRCQLEPAEPGPEGEPAWRTTLPGCEPGSYALAVEVTGVPGHGRVAAKTMIVVLAEHSTGQADEDETGEDR
jgi:hypothetical protein